MGEVFGRLAVYAASLAAAAVWPVAALIDLDSPIGPRPRSRGRQAKPKRRPNMLHVSRLVRRRHRRRSRG